MPIAEPLPVGWKIRELKDVVDINCESIDPRKSFPSKFFQYIDIDSVENGTGIIQTSKEIIGSNAPSRARRVVHTNDVIISTVRPYLKAFALVPNYLDRQICSTGFAVLKCREEIIPHYLLYSVFSDRFINQCNRLMVGAQYPALNDSQLKGIQILIPPIPEQNAITAILTTVDEAIQKSRAATAGTERLKEGAMRELFTKGIGHTEFKEDEVLGRIPKQWIPAKLEDIVKINRESRDPRSTAPNDYFDYIDIESIENGSGKICGAKKVLGASAPSRARRVIHTNDVIFSTVRPYLKAFALVPKEYDNTICSTGFAVLTSQNDLNPRYLLYSLFSDTTINQCNKMMVGAQYPALNDTQVKNLIIPLPHDQAEHDKIATILSTIDRKLSLQRQRTAALERLKKGLMDDLLTGRRRV